jgi:hypothetical protein
MSAKKRRQNAQSEYDKPRMSEMDAAVFAFAQAARDNANVGGP